MGLGFGVVVSQARPFADLADDWLFVESLGFDNAWLLDHFAPGFYPDGPWLESWTTLAALAVRTDMIRIGIAVTNAAVRNPGLLCKEAITVDHVSGGRLEVGIGAGYFEEEQRMLGIDYLDSRGRAERLREVVRALDRGLRGDTVDLAGQHWHLANLPMNLAAIQRPRPPLWVAAQSSYSLRTVALHADVLVTMGDVGDRREQTLPKLIARFKAFDEMCAELSRDAASVRRAYFVGQADDNAFESDQSFEELVQAYAEAGATDFILTYTSRSGSVQAADRRSLERIASELGSLRLLA